eukprot:5015215-Pleurochrysis_carterae.AAC.1
MIDQVIERTLDSRVTFCFYMGQNCLWEPTSASIRYACTVPARMRCTRMAMRSLTSSGVGCLGLVCGDGDGDGGCCDCALSVRSALAVQESGAALAMAQELRDLTCSGLRGKHIGMQTTMCVCWGGLRREKVCLKLA